MTFQATFGRFSSCVSISGCRSGSDSFAGPRPKREVVGDESGVLWKNRAVLLCFWFWVWVCDGVWVVEVGVECGTGRRGEEVLLVVGWGPGVNEIAIEGSVLNCGVYSRRRAGSLTMPIRKEVITLPRIIILDSHKPLSASSRDEPWESKRTAFRVRGTCRSFWTFSFGRPLSQRLYLDLYPYQASSIRQNEHYRAKLYHDQVSRPESMI